MHHLIIQYTCLLAIIIAIVMLAQKIKIAYPILLVIAGLGLGFVPGLRGIEIEPDMIFVIFLPPLLYEAAWSTSWKDFWKWRRVISSFAFIIVILTAGVVALVSSNVIPGFTLAAGFLLGGIVSPPDAVSATTILKNVKVPKRLVTILEGESLMNDAASLVIFRFAAAAVVTGSFAIGHATLSFALVIVMGILIGLAIALVFYAIHRWLPTTTNIDIILTFITPYAMYMAAEAFNFSGVLAVVSGGLFLSIRRDSFLTHRSRLQGINVWEAVAFVLNGFVFILIGLEFPVIIKDLGPNGLAPAIRYSAIISAVLIVTRLASTFGASVFTVFISRYITTADNRPGWKGPLLLGWAGMRGVVSLAAALSIPVALHSGAPFPNRSLILFITFSVILVTLILQGLTLPLLIKWVDMPDPDYTVSFEQQRQLVRKKLAVVTLNLLQKKYAKHLKENDMVKAIKIKIDADMELLADWDKADGKGRAEAFYRDYIMILEDMMQEQRDLLKTLNKKENINDDIIKQQLALLDLEQEKLRQHFSFDDE
ncbi:sodium/proton antiporter, CPA1 family [Mucilaginibacter lappiensis]|uniref:CPA1 family monovalent cation:H+ antiporter n=1 Tax=Mucilaginibacter lappiensis TaxID=354630 RepID=A0ABR6PRM0_9SPHI|nr:Na+/H+ antiporter [Mucilaginibacter lappiensis]MBB6112418.1 CPA1 family monovalent cation:H+ antiporter [Mucilaginibacter lappiensis]SIS00679.1 sodium/proton antiporter, CPA1 family [Mucilaginibacter lappiensis]